MDISNHASNSGLVFHPLKGLFQKVCRLSSAEPYFICPAFDHLGNVELSTGRLARRSFVWVSCSQSTDLAVSLLLCDLCLALPLLAVPKEPNTGCNVFVFVSQYFVRGCICGRGGRVCALAVSPGWPLAPSGSLPHRHHYQRESWTGESPRSHPAPTPPRVHLPIVFWPWLTLHPPRIFFGNFVSINPFLVF